MKTIALITLCLCSMSWADSTINDPNKYAWGANVGWLNWRDAGAGTQGVVIGEYVCSGFVWGANVGWINLGDGTPANGIQYANTTGTDFGINHDGTGVLRGLAYGANIGWINFEATGNPRFDSSTGNFSGYAWSANCGWINLGDGSFFMKTNTVAMGADIDGDGLTDAFELSHAPNLAVLTAAGDFDDDGEGDLEEYFADTDPLDPADALRITNLTLSPDFSHYTLTWTSQPTRRYRIDENPDLFSVWTLSLDGILPDAGDTTMRTLALAVGTKRFFRVRAFRPLAP